MTKPTYQTITRRKLLATSAAGVSAFVASGILSGYSSNLANAQTAFRASDFSAGKCTNSHPHMVSALMVSIGGNVLSAHEKSNLLTQATCPSCGHSLTPDLMAEIACNSVSMTCETRAA